MIIGIDDTGDFRTVISYFNIVFLQPSRKESLNRDFRAWERNIRRELGLSGEVKGSNLGDVGLCSFVENVVIPNRGSLWFLPCGVNGTNDPSQRENCNSQRDHIVAQLETAISFYTDRDNGRSRIVVECEQLKDWYRALNDEEILKIWALGYVVPTAFKEAIDLAIYIEADSELDQLVIKIDESFISRRSTTIANWKVLLKSSLWQTLYRNPITMLDTWDDNHPFVMQFVDSIEDDRVVLSHNLRDSMNFVRSHEEFEVRIADITGYIVRRRNESQGFRDLFQDIKSSIPHSRIRMLQLDHNLSSVPSPYPPLTS